jgi:hypothetical protein
MKRTLSGRRPRLHRRRVGSQNTNISIINGTPTHNRQTFRSLTFPVSAAGHMRQNRFFLEAELKQNLDRLVKDDYGPLTLLNDLPVRLRNLKYNLTARLEYDGVYDYGPAEYRTAYQYFNEELIPPFSGSTINVFSFRPRCATSPPGAPACSRPSSRPTSASSTSASAARSWPGAKPTPSACSTTSIRWTAASAASSCRSTNGACRSTCCA